MTEKVDKEMLEYFSGRIEQVLAQVGVPISVRGSKVAPQFVEFMAYPLSGTTFQSVAARDADIGLATGTVGVRIVQSGNFIGIQVPVKRTQAVYLSKLIPNDLKPYVMVLGIAEQGQTISVNVRAPAVAHILVSGATGSGKTELIKTMLASLTKGKINGRDIRVSELGILIIDPKKRDGSPFTSVISPFLIRPIAYSPSDIIQSLRLAVSIIDKRSVSNTNNIPLIIAIDELADVCATGGIEATNLIMKIVARGREASVHLIGATQKPSARVIDGVIKANFPMRVVLRVVSPEDARVASGIAGSGANLLSGNGDAIACVAGSVIRFQSALCDLIPKEQVSISPSVAHKPLYLASNDTDQLQVVIAKTLNDNPGITSIRSLQQHIPTVSGKSYSGGAFYGLFVDAAAKVGFAPAVESVAKRDKSAILT